MKKKILHTNQLLLIGVLGTFLSLVIQIIRHPGIVIQVRGLLSLMITFNSILACLLLMKDTKLFLKGQMTGLKVSLIMMTTSLGFEVFLHLIQFFVLSSKGFYMFYLVMIFVGFICSLELFFSYNDHIMKELRQTFIHLLLVICLIILIINVIGILRKDMFILMIFEPIMLMIYWYQQTNFLHYREENKNGNI